MLLNAERPLLGNDLPRDVPVLADAASAAGIGKYGCVPLRSQERTLGVLIVSGPDGRALSTSDGDTLAIVGAQLGAAIENARLAAEAAASRAGLEAKTAQLSRLLAVSAGFAANMPIDAMLNTIAKAIVETLGFGSAHVRARDEDGTTLTGVGFCGYSAEQRERLLNSTPIAFYDRLLDPRFRLGGHPIYPPRYRSAGDLRRRLDGGSPTDADQLAARPVAPRGCAGRAAARARRRAARCDLRR